MNVKSSRQRIQADYSQAPIILVVEDEEDNLLFIAHALIYLQRTFITATTGQQALKLATKYKIDLILLDLRLPDLSGFDLARLLKQNPVTKNVPIIATSALVREIDLERAMEAGCADYLKKPYLISDLDRKLRQFLPQAFFKCNFLSLTAS